MKRRYMDYCIIGILKEYAAGRTTEELCRKHAMTDAILQIIEDNRCPTWPDVTSFVLSFTL